MLKLKNKQELAKSPMRKQNSPVGGKLDAIRRKLSDNAPMKKKVN